MYHPLARQALGPGLLMMMLLALAVSACAGGSSREEQTNKPRALPEVEKALRRSGYRTEEFKPSLSFRVGEGWTNASPEMPDILGVAYGESRRG